MKIKFTWLLAGLVACFCTSASAIAQHVSVASGFSVLVRTSSGDLVALSDDGALLRSNDGGMNFTSIRTADSPQALFTVNVSGTTVIAMGDAGSYVRSTNSGASFGSSLSAAITPAFSGEIRSIAASGLNWVAVGYRGTAYQIIRSTDGGESWAVAAVIPSASGKLHGVAWSGSRWIAVGENAMGGVILSSVDGDTWTELTATLDPLYAVASDGAGNVLAGGDAGALFYSAAEGAFTQVGAGEVSEAVRAVAFLSGTNWVAGGDSAVRLSFNGANSTVGLTSPADTNSGGAPITALAWAGTNADYYYSLPADAAPAAHGPISLTVLSVAGQLELTLVGAETGNSYYLESSTTLASWTIVASSSRDYTGGAAPTWTYSLPDAGSRVFYRAKSGTPAP